VNYNYLTIFSVVFLLSLSVVCASDINESSYEQSQLNTTDTNNTDFNGNKYSFNSNNNTNNHENTEKIKEYRNKNLKTDDTSNLNLNVSATDIKYGDNVNLSGIFTNNSIILTQKEITLVVNDDEYTTTTDDNGEYNFIISNYNIGLNDVLVFYNDETDFIFNTTTFTVRKLNTTTIITNASGMAHQNIIECAIITDEKSYVVNEGFVTFIIKNKVIGTADVINGLATLNFVYNTTLNDSIKAVYSGSEIYNPSNNSQILMIYKEPTNIILSPVFCNVQDTITFTAQIVGAISNVSSGKCVLKINGKTLKDENGKVIYKKVNNGIVSFNTTLSPTLEGIYNYTVVYSGSASYEASRATNALIINKRNYTINLNITPNSTKRGCIINLTATLNSSNITINTGKVIFKLNGQTIKDENGNNIYLNVKNNKAELLYTIPETLNIGEKTIKAVYINELNDRYDAESTFTITKTDLYIILEEIDYYSNKLVIKANIFNEFNQTIKRNITYAVKLNNITQIITNSTDSTINIEINHTYNANNYTLSIVIGENTGYNSYIYTNNISLYNPKISIENEEIYRCDNNNITMIIPEEYVNPNNTINLYLDELLLLNTTINTQNITTENYIPIFYEGNHTLHAIITNQTNQNITQTNKNINIKSHYIYVNSNGNINNSGTTIDNPTTLEKAINISTHNQIILLSTITENDTYSMNNIILNNTNNSKLNIIGQTNKTIILNGNNTNKCMIISTPYDVTFSNIKFINGYTTTGGLFTNYGNLTIINSTISNNHAFKEAGVIFNMGNLTLLDNNICDNSVLNDTYYIKGNSTTSNGGVLESLSGNIILINNTFNNNSCYYGGVIVTNNSSISLINNTFNNNKAKHMGGVVYYNETMDIQFNNLFINNTSQDGSVQVSVNSIDFIHNNIYIQNNGTKHGAFYLVESLSTLNNCTFEHNYANYASSIYLSKSNISINNSLFNGNKALVQGGSIMSIDSLIILNNTELINNEVINGVGGGLYSERSNIYLDNLIFNNNSAKYGGSIYAIGEKENIIENSQFTSNNAFVDGGAIYSSKGSLYLNNNTFDSNNAQCNGGAISTIMSDTLEITNSTFQNNDAANYTNIYSKETVTVITNNSFDSNPFKISVLTDKNIGNISNNYWGNNNPAFNIITNNNTPQTWKIIENNEYITINNTNNSEIETAFKIVSLTSNHTNPVNTLIPKKDVNILVDDILTTPDTNITINIIFSENITATIQIIFPNETFVLLYLNNTNQTNITYKTSNQEKLERIHINLIGNSYYMSTSKYVNIFIQENMSHFNLNDYNMITSVKNQGSSNACWAFASIATLESTILKTYTQTKDFSENHLKNIINKYNINGTNVEANTGSSLLRPINYMLSWTDPVNDEDDIFHEESTASLNISPIFHIQDVVFIKSYNESNPDYIKDAIIKYGALFTDFNTTGACDNNLKLIENNTYINNTINYYNPNATNPTHAITIIGWDDNYSKNNFNNNGLIPEGDGAFIIKNSWGTDWGLNGFNYISYYDKSIARNGLITFSLENQCNYTNIYQYETCSVSSINTNAPQASILNNYQSQHDEQIQAVGTFFDKESNYTVTIYKNNIEQYAQEGNINCAGFHTIKLKQYIPLNTGDNFTVIFTIKNENVKIFVQDALKISSENISDESFLSFNETSWFNLKKYHLTACIKIYTGINNQTNTNSNITHNEVNITIPHYQPSTIPNSISNENNVNPTNALYTIKIPLTYNLTIDNVLTNISADRAISIVVGDNVFDFTAQEVSSMYFSFNGTVIENPVNKEDFGVYISKTDDNNFLNIELIYELTGDINLFSVVYTSFTNHPGQLVNIVNVRVNDDLLCKFMFYPSYNYTVGLKQLHDDYITIFSYDNQIHKRVEHMKYFNNIYPDLIQTYLITKNKMNYSEFLTSSNNYINRTTNILNNVFYFNDYFADVIAEVLNVSYQRTENTILFCGYNGSTYISALNTTMGLDVEGDEDNKLMFRFITTYMLSFWEEKALNSSQKVNSALGKILNALESNAYNIFEDENYLYLVLNDETNTTLTLDKNTGVVVDYIQYGDNIIHGVQSDDEYTLTGLKVGSSEAELQRVVGSTLMSAAPYCIGIPVFGPGLVVASYVTGLILCADACGIFKQSLSENSSRWVDFGWDVATSLPVEHIIGFAIKCKKIANILKQSQHIEQSAKAVENTLKTTVKSTSHYIKTKTLQFAEKSLDFVEEQVTHISKVTETIISTYLKIIHLPLPKTVFKDFTKGFEELFKFDFEKLPNNPRLEQASYEIFCSKLNQPKSNMMGYLYFSYGYSKEAVENFYTSYSQKAFNAITLNVTNTILNEYKQKYNSYLIQYRNSTVKIEDYEHYYVAHENNLVMRCEYEIL